jgi:signal transduction histidine kinase
LRSVGTPLSVMRAEVELALMHERSPEAYRSALQRLQSETRRLEALAQSLILTTRDDAVAPSHAAGAGGRGSGTRESTHGTARDLAQHCVAMRKATNRFWRDDPSRSGEGTGLGLAIVRLIIERHKGAIVLQNAPAGTGSVVVLTVPVAG